MLTHKRFIGRFFKFYFLVFFLLSLVGCKSSPGQFSIAPIPEASEKDNARESNESIDTWLVVTSSTNADVVNFDAVLTIPKAPKQIQSVNPVSENVSEEKSQVVRKSKNKAQKILAKVMKPKDALPDGWDILVGILLIGFVALLVAALVVGIQVLITGASFWLLYKPVAFLISLITLSIAAVVGFFILLFLAAYNDW